MTEQDACRILGVQYDADLGTIKKQYRRLMHAVHPDALPAGKSVAGAVTGYTAGEIIEAYDLLKKHTIATIKRQERQERKKKGYWHATQNEQAYCERKVFFAAEDTEGENIGEFCIGEGKYMWCPEEDFNLFLKSIYLCSKELLDNADWELEDCGKEIPTASKRMEYQAELAYLLAVQFIDSMASLKALAEEGESLVEETEQATQTDGEAVYKIRAMLEKTGFCTVKTGERLYPLRISKHRLFLRNEAGQEVGYLSFLDDRLYYVIIPLFELRSVKVKLQADNQSATSSKTKRKQSDYTRITLWIRFPGEQKCNQPESIRLKIEALLRKYKE